MLAIGNNSTALFPSENELVTLERLSDILLDKSQPLPFRFRALFALRNYSEHSLLAPKAARSIASAFAHENGALFGHELAYCLGQMRAVTELATLEEIVKDTLRHPMVRHEAAEALGAIGQLKSLETLEKFVQDPCAPVRETCAVAIDNICKHHHGPDRVKQGNKGENNTTAVIEFGSVDPAPGIYTNWSLEQLGQTLLDHRLSIYDRYKALFSLRNLATDDACQIICKGLIRNQHNSTDSYDGALFRHEVAYVLGQLQNPVSFSSLARVLADTTEAEMVRHEAAEALGSLATDQCIEVLQQYLADPEAVVRESCEVALDMIDYERSGRLEFL